MKKIIFDNTAKGFPADENFMRATDEAREGLEQLCLGLLGNSATVILSGLELTKRGSGATATTTLSGGYVWAFGSLLAVEQQVWSGDVPAHDIYIGKTEEHIEAAYENGESLPAYIDKKGYVVVSTNTGMAGAILRNYSTAKRINLIGNSWLLPPTSPSVSLLVQASTSINGLALRGTAEVALSGTTIGGWLSVGNIKSGFGDYAESRDAIYTAAVEYQQTGAAMSAPDICDTGYVRISKGGSLSIYIDETKALNYNRAIYHINLTHR